MMSTATCCCLLVGAVMMAGCCQSSLVKRSDYRSPMEDKIARMTSDIATLTTKLETLSSAMGNLSSQVGFTAQVSQVRPIMAHTTVIFDRLLYNAGNSYDTTTGFFIAPMSGMYSFFISSEILPGQEIGYDVLREGSGILHLYNGKAANSSQTASSHVVLHVSQGDKVWVRSFWNDGIARTFTSFGGALLTPDISL